MREGDANTGFFHAHATARLRRNNIRAIEVQGVTLSSHEGKIRALTEYYRSALGTAPSTHWPFDVEALYRDRPQASAALVAPFSADEAWRAVRAMNAGSAPGPDGFGPSFYKSAWSTVCPEVRNFMNSFHAETLELERINRSFMVLLPKKPGAVTVDAFRPICLQNCSVKIASKSLTTRLQREIMLLVGPDQTGFLKGRSITENFVYALELVQVCHKRKAPALVVKLDFAKAFDTVSWDGLMRVMEVRGFPAQWRHWVLALLETSRTAVIVNGCPGAWITCKRGLR